MGDPKSSTWSRRDLFSVAGAGAALGLAAAIDADAAKAADDVVDKGADIRITAMRAIAVGGNIFIRIDTNKGVTGWGETAGIEPRTAVALSQSLFDLLDGENPTRIEHLWQKIYRAHRDIRGGPFMVHTLSAIDMALWDITGRLWGVPVYRLLGGPVRDKIRVYPSAKSFKAPPGGLFEHSATPPDINRMVDSIKAARKRVGPDGAVMFDAHCAVPPATLIQLAAAVEPSDVLFFEEVAVPGNIEVFKRLKQHIRIPLASGERDRCIWEFIPYLQEKALDILQPDVSHSGGISQMKKIATLAEAYYTPLAPHCTNTLLGIAASLHAIAAVPLFLIHEAYGFNTPRKAVKGNWEVDKDGYVGLPAGPGLGIEIDEKTLIEESKLPYNWKWPVYGRLKDGSIADY